MEKFSRKSLDMATKKKTQFTKIRTWFGLEYSVGQDERECSDLVKSRLWLNKEEMALK